MSVAVGIICAWPSTHASIPSGWSEETDLADRYPKGAAASENGGSTGGASTHSHSATSSHSHTEQNHTHTFTISGDSVTLSAGTADHAAAANHSHTGTSGSMTSGGLGSISATYGSTSNDPPYYTVVFIKSLGTANIPNNALAFFNTGTLPTSWVLCNGGSGSPDVTNKYLKGVTAGGDGGSTGGSTTNTHSLVHTHTANAHNHGSAGTTTAGDAVDDQSGSNINRGDHSHTITFDDAVTSVDSSNPSLVTTETVEPAYKKLQVLQNQSGAGSLPEGIICMWKGTLTTIPFGWVLCDGNNGTPDMRGYFIKSALNSGEASSTGGSNTHTHVSQTHTHSAASTHTHGIASGLSHVGGRGANGSSTSGSRSTSVHNSNTVNTGTSVYDTSSTDADSQNNEPSYLKVIFIQKVKDIGGAFLLNGL